MKRGVHIEQFLHLFVAISLCFSNIFSAQNRRFCDKRLINVESLQTKEIPILHIVLKRGSVHNKAEQSLILVFFI